MPWHPCVNSRDSITQADGTVISDVAFADDSQTVTSYCRTADGTWIAWINDIKGDSTESFDPDNDPNKSDWSARIASAVPINVGFFPDDGSTPIVYDLAVDPKFSWSTIPLYSGHDPCSNTPTVGQQYSDAQRGELVSWTMDVLDVQVRTDGVSVWVIVLAREDVRYPSLADCGATVVDRCGNSHPPIEDYYNSDPFGQDTGHGAAADSPFWMHYPGFGGGGLIDDSGINNSFRWNPARVTVFAGDIGGFTLLGRVEAAFNNNGTFGLCGDIEACASPAEPGVCHVVWAEGGPFGAAASSVGQRVNYSSWDSVAQILENDLLYADEADLTQSFAHFFHGGTKYNSLQNNWVWTTEYILRNDHGSPVLIICPWTSQESGPTSVEYWDLSGGFRNVLQVLSSDLYPDGVEAGFEGVGTISESAGLNVAALRRSQFASSLYTDPLDASQDVYLVCVRFEEISLAGRASAAAFYRIPCDGSAPFDFMDGLRQTMYSIVPESSFAFIGDFVSDPGNVWMPSLDPTEGAVLHLPRTCTRTWELLPAFAETVATWGGFGSVSNPSNVNPFTLVTDDSGNDWLAGGGYAPIVVSDTDPANPSSIQARICRCCVPCIERIGLHIWEQH